MKIAPILIIAFVLVTGCIGQSSENVNEAFIRYAELSATTDNYEVNYVTDYKITGNGETLDMNGEMKINKQDTDSYIYYSFQDPTSLRTIETHVYMIDNAAYSCVWESGSQNKNCVKTDQIPAGIAPDPVQEREQISTLLEEGIVTLESGGRKTIAGHTCEEIIINYNIEKVQEKMPPEFSTSSVSYMKQSQCYEMETGVPLSMVINIKLLENDQAIETMLTTTSTSFSRVNSVIQLPDDVQVYNQSAIFQDLNVSDEEY